MQNESFCIKQCGYKGCEMKNSRSGNVKKRKLIENVPLLRCSRTNDLLFNYEQSMMNNMRKLFKPEELTY